MLQVAVALLVPAVSAFVPQPEIPTPSLVKATVPVEGTLPPEVFVTVAVKVTDESTVDGLPEDETATLVASSFTDNEYAADPVWPFLSVEVIEKLKSPNAVGVPDNTPAEDSVRPVGNAPLLKL